MLSSAPFAFYKSSGDFHRIKVALFLGVVISAREEEELRIIQKFQGDFLQTS